MNLKDDRDMAIEVAKAILRGTVVAYKNSKDEKIETVPKWLVEKGALVTDGMVGVSIEDVARACQWDKDVITEATMQVKAEERKSKKHGVGTHEHYH